MTDGGGASGMGMSGGVDPSCVALVTARGRFESEVGAEAARLRAHDRRQGALVAEFLPHYAPLAPGIVSIRREAGDVGAEPVRRAAWRLAGEVVEEQLDHPDGDTLAHFYETVLDESGQVWRVHTESSTGGIPAGPDRLLWSNTVSRWSTATTSWAGHSDYRPSLSLLGALLEHGLVMAVRPDEPPWGARAAESC